MRGIVVKSTGSWYEVFREDGSIVNCRLRGQFRIKGIKNTNPVVVGDRVGFIMENDGNGCITDIEPRQNYIERKSTKLSKISHLIASNIDVVFLVVTLKQPRTSLGFIDRFLLSAEGFRISVCLIFNKIDLYSAEEMAVVKELENLYSSIGYDYLEYNALHPQNADELKSRMKDKVSLFSGHSGVGKSAIVNSIDPTLNLRTGAISEVHNKGTHTTTFAQMFPLQGGGFIIDTPGIKEFGLIQYSKEEIRDYFPEIRKYNNECRFDNCSHTHEPGCKVIEALKKGEIADSRYQNYIAILNDDDMKIADWKLK
ncbi:MAG: ribosome small subunit-dependent GTPase A [Bacteroidales bacterium]|nr:ribosome small subunit-dependent GTPase A [Bacteroidales bacterium]